MLRALELDKAYEDTMENLVNGKYATLDSSEKVDSYFADLKNELSN
jgi:hypothetical protein